MSGLLRKDWEIITLNGKFLILVIIMSLFVTSAGVDATFIQTYLSFMALFMVLNSISYDEMDNGMSYIMTLPVSRKNYVTEKYLLAILSTGITSIFGSVLALAINSLKETPITLEAIGASMLVSFLFSSIFAAILLPVVLKYGPEKGRLAIGIICAGVFGMIMLVGKLGKSPFIKVKMERIDAIVTSFLEGAGPVVLTVAAVVFVIIILAVSCNISTRTLERKEF